MYLTQSLHRAAQQTPEKAATIYGERLRSHRESAERISRLAGALRALGVAEGDRVAIHALNSDHFHEFLYAVWWIGAVANPVNTRWSAREIAHSLKESDTRILFVDDTFAPAVPALRELWDGIETLVHCGDGPVPEGMHGHDGLIAAHEPVEDLRAGGDRLAGLFYTGGTTGFPKGVMLSHDNILSSCLNSQVTAGDAGVDGRTLHSAPLFHLAGLATWNNQNVLGGSHLFLPGFEPLEVLDAVQRHRPTTLLLVPAMIQMLVDHSEAAKYDLSSVAQITYGASPISEALLDRAMRTFPGAAFVQAYGMTELGPVATQLTARDHRERSRLRSAGRAVAGVDVRVVDPRDQEVPRGTVGEVVARGDNVMLGFWNQPETTAAALRGAWMHTGDLGYMDEDGYLYIVDRLKDMIVTGGENVYSAEVENALAKHPAVGSCAVIGVPDPEWGERVHAVVVLKPGANATAEEIRTHVKTRIAGYKAPGSVEFVEALPLSGTGKILKRELRRPHWEESERSVN